MIDLNPYKLILGSKSPRRHELLKGLGMPFEVRIKDTDESFSEKLQHAGIAEFLARIKGEAFLAEIKPNELIVTSDTIVWLGDRVFNKPQSAEEAVDMIDTLSGRMHEVITGVSLLTSKRQHVFHDITKVYFGDVNREDIVHYVDRFKPFDKAGAYGIQEWIGYVGIERIEGSFYNVMGFPTRKFYVELQEFLRP